MIPDLNQVILILTVCAPLLILIMFLPALIELRNPKDPGPRLIMNRLTDLFLQSNLGVAIVNIEEEYAFEYALILRIKKIIEVLPSLEV